MNKEWIDDDNWIVADDLNESDAIALRIAVSDHWRRVEFFSYQDKDTGLWGVAAGEPWYNMDVVIKAFATGWMKGKGWIP